MKKFALALIVFILIISKSNASIIKSDAAEYFLNLAGQADPSQSITNEWQIGMYSSGVFELFDYSATTVLGRPSIVGWVKQGFHAGFLNTGVQDELFPGNVFEAGALTLHPGQSGADIVLRYLVQQEGVYDIFSNFFALDTIECNSCNSDGVNVSVRVNRSQLNDSRDLTGFGTATNHSVIGTGITLREGDLIDLIVMPKSNFFDDATKVSASVSRIEFTAINEPTILAMMLLMTSLIINRRRRNYPVN